MGVKAECVSKRLGVSLIALLLIGACAGVTEASVIIGTGDDCDYYTLDIGPSSVIGYSSSYPNGEPVSSTGIIIDEVIVRDGGVVYLAGGRMESGLYVQGGEAYITGGSVFFVSVDGGELYITGGSVDWLIDTYSGVVTVYGTDFAEDTQAGPIPLPEGAWIPGESGLLTGFYEDGSPIDLLFNYFNLASIYLASPTPSGPMPISIDIRPYSAYNRINPWLHWFVPVAIFSAADFDATALPLENIFFGGAPVCTYGRNDRYAAMYEDLDGDGLVDLMVLVKTWDLQFDSEWFEDGGAYLAVCEEPDPDSAVLGLGWDEITIVQPRCRGPWPPRWHGKSWSGKSVGRAGPKKSAGSSGKGKGRR